uniref:Uncharacterized protein n=1 Tax=Ditylenchus dipsaci TaxID=166011 RepID=A0A915CRQ0_9BILA
MKIRKRNKSSRGENFNGVSVPSRNVPIHLEGAAKLHQVHAANNDSMPQDISWPVPRTNSNFEHHTIDKPSFLASDTRPPTSRSWTRNEVDKTQKNNGEKRSMPSSPAPYSPYLQHSSQVPVQNPSAGNEDGTRGLRRF